ncbi:MAG: SUMF1/EgtB/PvdO family nonheme iron enzyme [Janthinobacterium lividum]
MLRTGMAGAGPSGASLRAAAMPARRRARPLVWISILGAAGIVIATLLFSQKFWGNTAHPAKAPASAPPRSETSAAPGTPLPATSATAPAKGAVSPNPDVATLPPVALPAPPAPSNDGAMTPAAPGGSTGSATGGAGSATGAAAAPKTDQAAAPPASLPLPTSAPDAQPPRPADAPPTQAPTGVASAPATAPAAAAAIRPPAAIAAPSMIEMPGGSFRMGSSNDSTERPTHTVTLAPFLLATHATTMREWQQCVDAKACPAVSKGKPDEPITNVSWDDAKGYAAWLSGVTKQPFRLPTEAEWEYAARAGTETRYAWGNALMPGKVSCKGCAGPVSLQHPPRIDAYPPNAFGFLGMGGGVAEWVADCWHRTYGGAPRSGSVWDVPNCRDRVLRGGSWMEEASAIRPASRQSYDATVRYPTHGVRLAQSK